MTQYLVVHVTQADIDQGQADQEFPSLRSETCPLARALNRQYGGEWLVSRYYCQSDTDKLMYAHSEQSYRFITTADKQLPLQPTTFKLPLRVKP